MKSQSNKAKKKNILLLSGGGHTEHEISLISANYIEENLSHLPDYELLSVEIGKDKKWRTKKDRSEVELRFGKKLVIQQKEEWSIDLVIPCLHGYPGETGDIQSLLELQDLPYFGPSSESSKICFNKLNTKLWLEALRIPHTPFIFLLDSDAENIKKAESFLQEHGKIFIKATNQGSSVGCYPAEIGQDLEVLIRKAFQFSPYVILEKCITGRELEVSVFEYQGKLQTGRPGEIICPSKFYSYEEKYSANSLTQTLVEAPNLEDSIIKDLEKYSLLAFKALKLRHLARIDFFLSHDNRIYLNEINTFPGLTPISMFPKMMEHAGVSFRDFLIDCLSRMP